MEVIELEDRKIIRPKKGWKVKFENDSRKRSEIVVKLDDERKIKEVRE